MAAQVRRPCLSVHPPLTRISLPKGWHRDRDLNVGRLWRIVGAARHADGECEAKKCALFIVAHVNDQGGPDWGRGARRVACVVAATYAMSAVMAGGIPLLESGVLALDGGVATPAPPVYLFHKVLSSGGRWMSVVVTARG